MRKKLIAFLLGLPLLLTACTSNEDIDTESAGGMGVGDNQAETSQDSEVSNEDETFGQSSSEDSEGESPLVQREREAQEKIRSLKTFVEPVAFDYNPVVIEFNENTTQEEVNKFIEDFFGLVKSGDPEFINYMTRARDESEIDYFTMLNSFLHDEDGKSYFIDYVSDLKFEKQENFIERLHRDGFEKEYDNENEMSFVVEHTSVRHWPGYLNSEEFLNLKNKVEEFSEGRFRWHYDKEKYLPLFQDINKKTNGMTSSYELNLELEYNPEAKTLQVSAFGLQGTSNIILSGLPFNYERIEDNSLEVFWDFKDALSDFNEDNELVRESKEEDIQTLLSFIGKYNKAELPNQNPKIFNKSNRRSQLHLIKESDPGVYSLVGNIPSEITSFANDKREVLAVWSSNFRIDLNIDDEGYSVEYVIESINEALDETKDLEVLSSLDFLE